METPLKILHLDSNHPLLIEKLRNAGYENHEDYTSSKEDIQNQIKNYNGIVIRSRFSIDREFIDKAQGSLQFIARVGAGLENIDSEYAAEKGIHLISAPEGNRNAVGEHTLAMLLALFNKLTIADSEIRSGHWNREKNRGHELDGKTVGIIGYGNMGKAFAKKLRGFDVNVLCHDILPHVGDANAKQVSLDELQRETDVLSLHIPWTAQTNRLVNSEFIDAFAKPFWFINTSRGKNVVTSDLTDALKSGKILGAALDVIEYEKSSFEHFFSDNDIPAEFEYLLNAENVLMSPHVAGWTVESHERLATVVSDKILELNNNQLVSPQPRRVTGIGGLFFKSENSKELVAWYGKHLGLKTDQYGSTFWWKDNEGNDCSTQWSPFAKETTYFEPSQKQFMQNFRVENLDWLLEQLRAEGVPIVGSTETYDYGKFAWILDPEGNKIELWEPIDRAFL